MLVQIENPLSKIPEDKMLRISDSFGGGIWENPGPFNFSAISLHLKAHNIKVITMSNERK